MLFWWMESIHFELTSQWKVIELYDSYVFYPEVIINIYWEWVFD